MNVDEACRLILGEKLANAIISDQGPHWAVVAAMAAATTDHDPLAIKALRDYVDDERAAAEHGPCANDFL